VLSRPPACLRFTATVMSIHSPQLMHRQAATDGCPLISSNRESVSLGTMSPRQREQTELPLVGMFKGGPNVRAVMRLCRLILRDDPKSRRAVIPGVLGDLPVRCVNVSSAGRFVMRMSENVRMCFVKVQRRRVNGWDGNSECVFVVCEIGFMEICAAESWL